MLWLPFVWRGTVAWGGASCSSCYRQDVLASLDATATIDLRLPDVELEAAFSIEAARGIGIIMDYVWGRPRKREKNVQFYS